MKPVKIIATLAIGVGVAAGATGVSAGVANADPGPGVGPVPVWGAGRTMARRRTWMGWRRTWMGWSRMGRRSRTWWLERRLGTLGRGMPIRRVHIGRGAVRLNTRAWPT